MLKQLVIFKNLKKSFHFMDCIFLVFSIMLNIEKIKLPYCNRHIYLRKKTKDTETFLEIFNTNIYNLNLPIVPITIIDAGANVGFSSLFFSTKYPKADIVAIEIEALNFEMIKKNTIGLSNITIEKKALYSTKSFFKIEDPFNATNSFVIKEVAESEGYDIESITINEILINKKWDTIDILKIDIEGAEKKLFEYDYQNWLPKTKIIMIETHDRMVPKCSYTVMKIINKYNFILYTTTEGTLIYYNMSLVNLQIQPLSN